MWWVSRCHAQSSVTRTCDPRCPASDDSSGPGRDCHNSLPLSLNLENDFFDPAPDSVGLRHLWRDVVEPFTAFVAYRCQLLMEWVRAESAQHDGLGRLNITYTQWTMQIIPAIPAQHFSYFQQRMCPTIRISLMNQNIHASRVQICQFEDFNELWKE